MQTRQHTQIPRAPRRQLRARATALVSAAALAVGVAAGNTGPARADTAAPTPPNIQAAAVDPAVMAAESAASAQARSTGTPVTVDAETDTGTLVTANPDGSFTRTQDAAPVRTRQNGAWVPIDATLAPQPDGTVRPKATTTGVAFSGGGAGPMATLTQGLDSLSFTFPVALPAPTLSGATATYPDVLPGVDLQLVANASGFSELIVVRTPAAAADPRLKALTLATKATGVTVADSADGGASATDAAGRTVFHSDTATMWDSSAPAARHVAKVAVNATKTGETLTPDQTLMKASTTRYPIVIDPNWSGNPSQLHWARVSSNGWNIYDSTSTASGDHPRVGIDSWPGGAGETARTYYQMNTGGTTGTSGIGGATVTAATLSINDDWAASGSDTPTAVYLTAAPVSNTWNSTDLNWGNMPLDNTKQDQKNSHEVDPACGPTANGGDGNTCQVTPGTLQFNILNAAQAASGGNWPNVTLVVHAPDDNDATKGKNEWKQFASGGGASISVTYYRAPYLSGTYNTTPGSKDVGLTYTTSGNITMSALGGDTDGENVRSGYEIWNWANGTNTTNIANSMFSGYTASGGAYTYSGGLADGTYAWRGVTESVTGGEWSGWSPWQVFTVDTSTPNAPTVESPQFPKNEYGAAFGTPGAFTFSNDQTNNVKGYMFALDGDIGGAVYNSTSPPPTWTGSGSPILGKVYWLSADNSNGTGTYAVNGSATAQLTPAAAGPHRLFAKAVDQAGNTSGEFTDPFYAGTTTPTYVYGDQLANGYTAGDGTVVPKATWHTTNGAILATQGNCCGVQWADGHQAFLGNNTGAVQAGDTATMSFDIPTTGYWDLGANLSMAHDYGQYSLTLDSGTSGAYTLDSSFDAFNYPNVTSAYQDFGGPKDASGNRLQLTAGVHTLTLTVTGKNSSSGGYQAGIDVLRLAPTPTSCTIGALTACLNNTAISSDTNTSAAGYGADGWGTTLSAGDLTAAGWAAGTAVTVDGAPMTVPNYADGKPDNMVASGQTVDFSALTGAANNPNAVVFLGFGTNGGIFGATGTVTYTSPCYGSAVQGYTLQSVPDWSLGAASAATITFPHRNVPGNSQDTKAPSFFAVSVPLQCPGLAIKSVTLPVVSNGVSSGQTALHILGLGLRPASFVAGSGNGQNWTGTFADQQDSIAGGLNTQTVRMPVRVTIGNTGTGAQVRIHLSNQLGTTAVSLPHVTIAPQDTTALGATAAAAPTPVTFNNNVGVVIPAGGDIVSDPVNLTVAQESTLLVSIQVAGTVTNAPAHGASQSTTYLSASGSGDHTGDTAATSFAAGLPGYQPYLTGIDVTNANNTSGSLVVFGDHTINADAASGDGNRLTDQIASQLAALSANSGAVPYGVLNEGHNNWNTGNNLLPAVSGSPNPQNAANPADRSILAQANVRTVLISTGTDDLLANTPAGTIESELAAFAQQVRKYYADTSGNNSAGFITVYVATIPPDARFTSTQEQAREAVNSYIMSKDTTGSYLNGNADGAIDFAAAVSNTGTDAGTSVAANDLYNGNPDNAYYRALAQQYVTSSSAPPPAGTGTVTIQPNFVRPVH